MKLESSRKIGKKKYSNAKFNKNSSSESPVVSCGRADGQADMTRS
jgi:hypothetical protein